MVDIPDAAGATPFRALLWREYRMNREVLIAGAFAVLGPYLLMGVVYLAWRGEFHLSGWDSILAGGADASFMSSLMCFALLGAGAIAVERADRSGEFIGYLPVSRQQRLASKLALAATTFTASWAPNLAVCFLLKAELGVDLPRMLNHLACVLITGVAVYAIAWFVSSFQDSALVAAIAGLALPILVISAFFFGWAYLQRPQYNLSIGEREAAAVYFGIFAVMSAACMAAGCTLFLRRVEP